MILFVFEDHETHTKNFCRQFLSKYKNKIKTGKVHF